MKKTGSPRAETTVFRNHGSFAKKIAALFFMAVLPICQAGNLLNNADFSQMYGDHPMDWGINTVRFPNAVKLLPKQGPQQGNAVRLDLSSMVTYTQHGLRLVAGEKYLIGAWVRTRGFSSSRSGIVIYNYLWRAESGVSSLPADTHGEWVKLSQTISCPYPDSSRRNFFYNSQYYGFSIYAVDAKGELEVASPFLIPVSDKAKAFSRRGKSLLENDRIVPVSPRLAELPSQNAVIDFYWPNSPGGKVNCVIESLGSGPVRANGEINDHRVKLHFPELPVGPGVMHVEVDRGTGEGFLPAGSYGINILESAVHAPVKRLNNLVSEIPFREIGSGRYSVVFSEGGWLYLKTRASQIDVDGRVLSGYAVDGGNEFMCRIPAGSHVITLNPSAGAPLSVRKIPEILVHEFNYSPVRKGRGHGYDEGFWKQYLLPNINSPAVESTWSFRNFGMERLTELRRSGRQLMSSCGIHARKKNDPLQMADDFRYWQGMLFGDGRLFDELSPGTGGPVVDAFAEALWQLQNNPKPASIWLQMGGDIVSPEYHTSLISAASNTAGGQGKLLAEVYCRFWADEKRLDMELSRYREIVRSIKSFYPDYPKHLLMIAGGYNGVASGYFLMSDPECDPKVAIDRLFRMCATDPVFADLYGIGVYAIRNSDEEMVRWYGSLFRHYGIEGQKKLLSEKYGFQLKTGYLKNGDFTEGLKNWTAQGKVDAGFFPNFGKMQGRKEGVGVLKKEKEKLGDAAAVLSPGSSISQTAAGLVPGRRYSVTCIVAPRKMVEKQKDGMKIPPEIQVSLSDVDQIGCQKVVVNGILTVKTIFTAKKAQAQITFSLPPEKTEEMLLNYAAVRPYFSDGAVGVSTATVTSVSGKDLFPATKVQDFANGSGVSTSGNTLLVPRGKFLQSAKRFAYDPGKRYKLSCTVRLAKGESGKVFLGFVPLDAAGKKILSGEINAIPKSLTTLASAAGKGATELVLTDGSRWNNTTPYGCIAFNADEKFSDLPNRTVVPMVKGSVEKRDGKWVAQLKKPLKNGYEAGTAVRQHVESDAFIYGAKKNLTGEKQQLTAVFSGHAANGLSSSRAWKGTAQVQVMIGFTSADAAGVMEISELKLEELL